VVRTNEWAVDEVGKKAECSQGSSLLVSYNSQRERERERVSIQHKKKPRC